jgi:hypothetical protein
MECDCGEIPPCPSAATRGACEARVRTFFPEHGCSLLCNGVFLFDDGSAILPGGGFLPALGASTPRN